MVWDDGMSEETKERRRARAREWNRANRPRHNANREASSRRHPERRRARRALQRAVRLGRIVRKPCEVCGAPDTHGHHDDYSRPLDVRWLCPQHHVEADAAQRRAA